MRGFSLLLVLSLIFVAICEAKKKRKKFRVRKFGVNSGESGEGAYIFQSDPFKGNLINRVKSKFWRFLGRLINLSKSFWDNYILLLSSFENLTSLHY